VNAKELIHQYLLGNLDASSVEKLNQMLADDPELRSQFAQATNVDAALREFSIERSLDEVHGRAASTTVARPAQSASFRMLAVCAAALALIALGLWVQRPQAIANIVSSEDAAWESVLPTSPGSDLNAGVLNLRTGIATIEFRSGAEMTLEAPAQLELLTKMRARLNSGTAVMNVPDSATGFVLETPDGYAIDFGTRFAVRIDADRKTSDFELIEGEIEVHQPKTGKSLRLTEAGAAASVSEESLNLIEDALLDESAGAPDESGEQVIRISTQGRCGTALARDRSRKRKIRSGHLYASHTKKGLWDHRSFFEFDLTSIDREKLTGVKLRINQVQSHRGSASLLPKINRFAVHGMTNAAKANWDLEPMWAEAPSPDDGELVGAFEIPRSKMRGSIEIDTPELLSFVKEHGDRPVTLILTRETGRTRGPGPAMPHTFASDTHPEAVGPLLELTVE